MIFLIPFCFTYAVDVVIDVAIVAVANDDEEETLKSCVVQNNLKRYFS